jgi:DNA mismatch endonuclease (patch repair protein)
VVRDKVVIAPRSPRGAKKLQTDASRSRLMAKVRSVGNKTTELRVVEIFRQHQIKGWRRHRPLLGKPDFAFLNERLLVFVDGCFWHGCPRCYVAPRANSKFWREKFRYNSARDSRITEALRRQGWKVIRLWEHDLKEASHVARRVRKLLKAKKKR